MQVEINKDNYEIVFFNILEGTYSERIKSKILSDIEKDSFLAFEWGNWKKTKLKGVDSLFFEENFTEFFDGIKTEAAVYQNEDKKKVIPLYFVWASVAACLLFALFLFTGDNTTSSNQVVQTPLESSEQPLQTIPVEKLKTTEAPYKINDHDEPRNKPKAMSSPTVAQDNRPTHIQKSPDTEPTIAHTPIQDTVNHNIEPLNKDNSPTHPMENNGLERHKDIKLIATETPNSTDIIAVEKSPKKKYKFSVETTDLPPQIVLTSVAQLSEMNISISSLMKDKRVLVVRNSAGVFLRLENEEENIYIALNSN